MKGNLPTLNSFPLTAPLFEATRFPFICFIVKKNNDIHIKSEFSHRSK
jgi:hypothetical protein